MREALIVLLTLCVKGCPTGTYSAAANLYSQSQCSQCPAGTFTPYLNTTACALCSPGTYTPSASSTNVLCTACAAGTYLTGSGSSVCFSCLRGTYSSMPATTSLCITCMPGTWQSAQGSTVCQTCAQGSISTAYNASACQLCVPGSYAALSNQTSCAFCSAGYYQSSQGSTSCQACPVANYSAYSNGSTACAACPALTSTLSNASVSAAQCLCIMGYYLSQACVACPPGSYKNVTSNNALACTPCPAFTYDTTTRIGDRTTILICTKVPDFASSPAGSATFTCNAGYILTTSFLGPQCAACAAGSYAPSNSTYCTLCVNSFSPQASPSVMNCSCNAGYYRTNLLSDCQSCPASLLYYCPGEGPSILFS